MRKALAVTLLGYVGVGCVGALAQAPKTDHASSYYHYTVAHMYAELASAYRNRTDYVNQAIDHYKEAIKADPSASMLSEELSDLYVQTGRLREAQTDAEDTLKKNPNDLNAHRLLARIFTRMVGDGGKVDESMLKKAIEEYQKVAALAPRDVDALLMLARLQKASDNSYDSQKTYEKVLAIDPAAGAKFDPHQHQAISMVPADQEANTIVTVLQKGYLIADRILRPALVTVAAPK